MARLQEAKTIKISCFLFFFFNVLSLVYFIDLSIQAKRDCTGHCDWGLLLFFSTLGSCLAESELASVSLC